VTPHSTSSAADHYFLDLQSVVQLPVFAATLQRLHSVAVSPLTHSLAVHSSQRLCARGVHVLRRMRQRTVDLGFTAMVAAGSGVQVLHVVGVH
jgi:hypothetical protein